MKAKKKLKVSEVAELLGVSSHTIRYYAREGLVYSEIDEESGYRLFNYEHIYHLSNIILLRDSGISIKEIKNLVSNYSTDLYDEYLRTSLDNVNKKIEELKMQRIKIKNNIDSLSFEEDRFIVAEIPERKLKIIGIKSYFNDYPPQEFYCDMKKKDIKGLTYERMYCELREDEIAYCVENDTKSDILLKSGIYLQYVCWIEDEKFFETKIDKFMEYAKRNKIELDEELYMKIAPDALLVVEKGYVATFFSRITTTH